MASCCWPTLLQKITSDLVAALRFGRKRREKRDRKESRQQGEKRRIKREEKKEKMEKSTSSVQLVCLLGLVGKKEREVKESGAACSKAERERKAGSFKKKSDNIVLRESRLCKNVQQSSTCRGSNFLFIILVAFSWQLWLACFGVVAMVDISTLFKTSRTDDTS